jgi:hypothetical protein
MQAMKIHTKTDSQGQATINVKTSIPDSELDLIVLIEDTTNLVGTEVKKLKYDLSEFVGKIKWDIDPLEYQKKMRDEW